jgi:hypothetical protein
VLCQAPPQPSGEGKFVLYVFSYSNARAALIRPLGQHFRDIEELQSYGVLFAVALRVLTLSRSIHLRIKSTGTLFSRQKKAPDHFCSHIYSFLGYESSYLTSPNLNIWHRTAATSTRRAYDSSPYFSYSYSTVAGFGPSKSHLSFQLYQNLSIIRPSLAQLGSPDKPLQAPARQTCSPIPWARRQPPS